MTISLKINRSTALFTSGCDESNAASQSDSKLSIFISSPKDDSQEAAA